MINQIIHGDCLEVMRDIKSESIDMILCDLPYGTTQCKWDSVIPFDRLWLQYKRIIKEKGAIVLTAAQPFTSALIMSNINMFKYSWVWVKSKASGHLDSKRKPMRKHEDIMVFCRKGYPKYNPQGLVDGVFKTGRDVDMKGRVYGQYKNHGTSKKGNYPKSVIEFANPSGKGHLHPTQKPVPLFEYLINTYTDEGDLVLDNCIGSGTTAEACINTGRNFIGIELDEGYHKIATDRIQEVYDSSKQTVNDQKHGGKTE